VAVFPRRSELLEQRHVRARSSGELAATPRHVPAAEAGTEFIQFNPRDRLAETVAAMIANAQWVMQGG